MSQVDVKKEIYSEKDIQSDYDAGLSIELIAMRYKRNREFFFSEKISSKKAYEEVCKIIYEFIMGRKSIVKRRETK